MDITRVSSGITNLDDLLDGGIPRSVVISLYGKRIFSIKPVRKFIQADPSEQVLYITTKDSVDTVLSSLGHHDNLNFLDAVHWRIKRVKPSLESKAEFTVSNLTDLNALLAKIMEACKTRNIQRIVFDSPTSLLLYSTPGKEQVFRFFELLTAYTRSSQMTMYYLLEEGVHQPETVATMHFLSDGIFISNRNHLRVESILLSSIASVDIEFNN